MPMFETVDTLAGSGDWTCPAGVFMVFAQVWGAGGGGGGTVLSDMQGGGGGGGGAFAAGWVRTVPGNTYSYRVPAAGSGGSGVADGSTGQNAYFNGEASNGVSVESGRGGLSGANGGLGGEGGAVLYDGIPATPQDTHEGGSGSSTGDANGGGGGGSAAPGLNGNNCNTRLGAAAVTGGGNGGNGGTTGNGSAPTGTPGGGGGGAGVGAGTRTGGAGKVGKITVSYSKMRVLGSSMMVQ
jgi:hypothetical protein